jgi:hypothetical protein
MDGAAERIACIGWGSLVNEWGSLPCNGVWADDGPVIPVEFARESQDGRMTLVICPGIAKVGTYWTILNVADLPTARDCLGLREYPSATPRWIAANIGFCDLSGCAKFGQEADTIEEWAKEKRLRGAVWTNLTYGFKSSRGVMPTSDAVIAHIEALDEAAREKALRYVKMAPPQTDTIFRQKIRQTFSLWGV